MKKAKNQRRPEAINRRTPAEALLLPLLLLGYAPYASAGCPSFMKQRHFKCDQQRQAGLGDACDRAERAYQSAYQAVVQTCNKATSIGKTAGAKTGDAQTTNQANNADLNKQESDNLNQGKAKMSGHESELADAQKTMPDKVQEGGEKAQSDPGFHHHNHRGAALAQLLPAVESAASQMQGGGSRVTAPSSQSPLLQEQVQTYNDMSQARQEIQQEMSKMSGQSQQMAQNGQQSNDRKGGLDSMQNGGGGGMPQPPGGGGQGGGDSGASSGPGGGDGLNSGSPTQLAQTTPGVDPASADSSQKTGLDSRGSNTYDLASGYGLGGGSGKTGYSASSMNPNGTPASLAGGKLVSGAEPLAQDGDPKADGSGTYGEGLRSSLRDQLARMGFGSSGASSALPDGTKAADGSDKSADKKTASSDSPAGGGGGSEGGDDALQPFGNRLGDPKVALAGSETDDSVKKMVEELGGSEGDREPASAEAGGIGDMESLSLFQRMRTYHDRCMRRGCVVGSAGSAKPNT